MNIEINNKDYNLHIISLYNYKKYEKVLEQMNICDTKYISNNYENASYSVLEYEGYVGFILTNTSNTIVYISLIIDINCSTLNYRSGILDTEKAVEISLLCANKEQRVIGLTKSFVNIIIRKYIPQLKKNVNKIYLFVSKGIDMNKSAFDFYSKIGFNPAEYTNLMEYNYPIGGGKRKKTRKYKK